MTPERLESKTKPGNCTALYFAAQSEIVTIAEVMVKKNNKLPMIPKDDISKVDHFTRYITQNSGNCKVNTWREGTSLVSFGNVGQKTFGNWQQKLAISVGKMLKLLGRFCNKALMQASAHQLVYRLWKQLRGDIYFSSTAIDDDKHMMKLLVEATKVGNLEFVIILIRSYPDLIWQVDKEYGTLFHVAVKHRQERVFNLIYDIGVLKGNLASYEADGGNNMAIAFFRSTEYRLRSSPSNATIVIVVSSTYMREIEKIVPKLYVNKRNEEGETPRDILKRTHKELQKNGEIKIKICTLMDDVKEFEKIHTELMEDLENSSRSTSLVGDN
ncbi:uncharacterized protein LOC118344731 [Juglans regia]|uniref:Uncharacterized protein LOC118344731 n=1 Tax=Juglans regia TaxID=51240 RepID=A0A6P9E3J1_JUGRE|nr:uncharacterized protein LOC118344731 [Juglans regia]